MPPQKKKPAPAAPVAPKTKPVKKKAEVEESKNEESKNAANEGSHDDALSEVDEEEQLAEKYGVKQIVKLDLQLPTEEKELIPHYEMRFIDRNFQLKQKNEGEGRGFNDDKPSNLNDASIEYEAKLSDVVVYLKKCGYPLENCFVAIYSPIFSAYVNCGLDPLPLSIKISKEDLLTDQPDSYCLRMKFLWGIRSDQNGHEEGAGEDE